MHLTAKKLPAALIASAIFSSAAFAGELVINTDTSDPAPKAAFEALIEGFKAENPDIEVTWNLFDHEGYKTSIRNFLTADSPDLANWYAGNRMLPYVNAGLFEPVDDVWEENGMKETFASSLASMTIDGKIWAFPTPITSGGFTTGKIFSKSMESKFPPTGRSSKPPARSCARLA